MGRFFTRLGLSIIIFGTAIFSVATANEFRYDSHGKRDPFVIAPKGGGMAEKGIGSLASVKLEGVIADPKGGSFAVINGEVVRQGEKLGGVVVRKITDRGVQLEFEGKTFFIPVVEEIAAVRQNKESSQ